MLSTTTTTYGRPPRERDRRDDLAPVVRRPRGEQVPELRCSRELEVRGLVFDEKDLYHTRNE
jgi:hypothetical protein